MKRLLLLLLLVAWLAGPPASHAQSPEALKALADLAVDDGDKREAAVNALGGTRDPKWLDFLAALRDGNVYARTQGKTAEVVIGGAKSTKGDAELVEIASAYDRKLLGTVPASSLTEIAADRRLRIAIKPFLDADETRVQLASPDAERRRGAAMKLGHQADAAAATVVEAAIARERVERVRHALQEALALIRLAHGAPAVRILAAQSLGDLHSFDAMPALQKLGVDAAASPAERDAAIQAIRQIERWSLLVRTVETVFQGASLASILLLMALGLAIVFGLMGVINMAHGELMALGAYATFVVQGWFQTHWPGSFDYYFLVALPVSFLVAGVAGFLLQRRVIRFLYGRPLETLLPTRGVSLVIQQGLRLWFGAANVDVTSPRWLSGGIPVMIGVQLPYNRLFIIGLATVCVAAMYLLLFRTDAGLRIRAVTQNRGMAACLGVRARSEEHTSE